VRAAQDQDDAEAGEGENEYEQAGREDGGRQQREGHLAEGSPATGAQRAGRLFHLRVQVRPETTHNAQHHRVVVEYVGQEDRP